MNCKNCGGDQFGELKSNMLECLCCGSIYGPDGEYISPSDVPAEVEEPKNETAEIAVNFEEQEKLALRAFENQNYGEGYKILKELDEYNSGYVFENLSLYYLGVCMETGEGVVKDLKAAKEFFENTESLEPKGSTENLGICFYLLGKKYLRGGAVERDLVHAFKLFCRSGEDYGNVNALFNLGVCYMDGVGTAKNPEKAFDCFIRTESALPADSAYELGICYFDGVGIEKNHGIAASYYLKAAELGHDRAMVKIGTLYYRGLGVKQDYSEAFNWYKKAGELGNSTAQYNLGQCYMRGRGTAIDTEQAKQWFEKAGRGGNENARKELREQFGIELG